MEGNRLSKQWRSVGKTDNLAELSQLDEQVILDELKARYDNDIIYTYVGDILIAINPLKPLPIYRTQVSVSYKDAQLLKDPPHIYAVASHVYKRMLSDSSDQCIVISGESGAGKTESTKLVVKQIIEICNGNTQLEQQILQVNPLLEAFGNAKTVINGNSSRFGKYVRLLFHSGKVVGARFSEYLLEKSRVVHQNRGDANFHVFSYMFAGCSDEQKHAYRLKGPHAYKYTRSQATAAQEASLRNKYEELQNSMDLVGFSEEEQDNLLSTLSGVLAIGNIDFTVATDDGGELGVSHADDLQLAADLLGIHQGDLNDCLTRVTNKARGEQILRNFNKHQAEDARDAIAKVIYGRLFSWIVNKINQRLYPQQWASDHQEIGILDIFGFENFTSNNFEQACINLANEHLQFFFNEHIFSLEQDEYKSEGIRWNHISYSDNQPLLDLFLKRPMGILSLLDEESHFPQATDTSLVQKLNKNLQSHAGYKAHKSNTGKPQFTIRHYAGEVTYDVMNWLEKNRDTVPPTLVTILKHSSIALLSTIFRGTITRTGTLALQNRTRKSLQQRQAPPVLPSSTKKFTVGMQFKNSLQELIKNMSEAEPHFIRCLKPNKYQQADRFDDSYVLAQLSYTGMLQTVQIRRDGYSFRPLITDFVSTYQPLLFSGDLPVDRETCKQILRRAEIYDCHIGKTKVFLKYGQDECLADKLNVMVKSVTLLQSVVRGFLARCYVVRRKEVSRQQKEYIQGFMKTMYDRSEKFVRTQQGLLEEEMKLRQEERQRAAKEAAKVAAAEAAAAEAAAAEAAATDAAKKQAAKEAAAKKQAAVELLARKARQEAAAREAAEKLAAEKEAARKEEERKSRQSADVGVAVLRKKPTSNIGGDMGPPRRPAKSERLSAYVESQRLSMTSNGTKSQQEDELMPLPPPVPEPPVATARISIANRGASLRRQFAENRTKSVVERFSQFGDSSTADDEVLEDDFSAYKLLGVQMSPYGPVGLRQTTVEWFRATQLAKLLNPQGNRLYEWFHGIISRGKAEAQLTVKSVGAFMVRLSEKRLDYVLSFRAENRCRHYRVGLTPSNKYVVVGEAKVHKTLFHLVTFHQENSISNWSGLLTEPCGQADPSLPDYLDLLPNNVPPQPSPRTSIQLPNTLMQSSSNSNTAVPPPLPPKVNTYRPKAPTNYINYK